MICISWSDKSF